jgi:hypothetical protein
VTTPPDTVLVITGIGLSPFSARGVTQTYSVIDPAKNFDRTANGKLINYSPDQFKKYASTITFNDTDTPALDGVFPGDVVVVDWVQEFSYLTAGGSPAREVVEDSERVEGVFTFYRPRMTMLVKDVSGSTPEWDAMSPAQLDLEEE